MLKMTCRLEEDSSYQHQFPAPPLPQIVTKCSSTSAKVVAMSVVRSQAFANQASSCRRARFNNLLCNLTRRTTSICKSTKYISPITRSCGFATSLLQVNKISYLVLVTILLMATLTGSCEAVPLRPSRSVNGGHHHNSHRLSFPSISVPSSTGSEAASPVSLHGLDATSSLSIVSSLDILRQNMVMEILRRKHRQNKQRQVQLNKEILDRIG